MQINTTPTLLQAIRQDPDTGLRWAMRDYAALVRGIARRRPVAFEAPGGFVRGCGSDGHGAAPPSRLGSRMSVYVDNCTPVVRYGLSGWVERAISSRAGRGRPNGRRAGRAACGPGECRAGRAACRRTGTASGRRTGRAACGPVLRAKPVRKRGVHLENARCVQNALE